MCEARAQYAWTHLPYFAIVLVSRAVLEYAAGDILINTDPKNLSTASGLLPAGIAVYVQRGPNGVSLETGYSVGL